MADVSSHLPKCHAITCWDQVSRRRKLAMGRPIEEGTMTRPISRRHFIRISAAAAGLTVVPVGSPVQAGSSLVTWHGTMLGAIATMQIHHEDRNEAQCLVQAACGEARRLERLFSLYLE